MRTVAKEGLHGRGLVSGRSMEDRTVTSHPQSGIVKLQGGDGRWYHVVALPSAVLALRACFACCCLFLSGDSAVVAGFVLWFLFIFRLFLSVWAFFWLFCGSFWCCVALFLSVFGLEKGRKEGGTAAETSARYLRLFRSSFLTPTIHLVRNILRSIECLFVAVIG
jgi:hypothetical protein